MTKLKQLTLIGVVGLTLATGATAMPCGGKPPMKELISQLNLNEQQQAEVKSVLKQQREQMHSMREQFQEQHHEEMESVRLQTLDKLSSILTASQMEQFEAWMEAHKPPRRGPGGPGKGPAFDMED